MRTTLALVVRCELRRLLRTGLGWVLFVLFPLIVPALCILGTPLLFPDVSNATSSEGTASDDPDLEARKDEEKLKRKLIPMQLPGELLAVLDEQDRIEQKDGPLPAEGPLDENSPLVVVSYDEDQVTVTLRRDLMRSGDAVRRLEPVIERASEQRILDRLLEAGFSADEALAVEITTVDHTEEKDRLGRSTGAYVPLLLFLLMLTGAMYSSVDLVTGEREHGTAETVLSSAVNRRVLMTGKALVVLAVTELSMLLGLCSIGSLKLLPGTHSNQVVEGLDGSAFGLLLLLSLPLSAQIAGLTLCVASWAPTYRSFSIATVPLMVATTVAAALPTIQLIAMTPVLAMMPLANVAMVSRELLAGTATPGLTSLAIFSALAWSGATLWVASRYLAREAALLGGRPQKKQSQVQRAVTLWGVTLGVLWFFGQIAQASDFVLGMLFTQLVIIAGTGLVGLMFWSFPIRETCSLRRPRIVHILLGILVGLSLPALGTVVGLLQSFVLPVSESAGEDLTRAILGDRSFLATLALIAVLPALCEELFFRGALLGLLRGAMSDRGRVVLVAVFFGLFHISLSRILPTGVLGLVLGLLVLWTGSLWPAVLAHFLNNGLAVTVAFFELGGEEVPLPWAIAGSLVCLGLLALVRKTRTESRIAP